MKIQLCLMHGYQQLNNKAMIRITKSKARKLYNEGKNIVLCPSKCGASSSFATEVSGRFTDVSFDTTIDHFHYYNCDKERGNVIHYYSN